MQAIKTHIDDSGRYHTTVTLTAQELTQIDTALKRTHASPALLRKIAVAQAMQDAAREITTATPRDYISPDVLEEEGEEGEP